MSLLDLAIEKINEAKNTRDAQSKLFLLEQVKEIIFHRDKSILTEVAPDVIELMVDRSTPGESIMPCSP